MSGHKKRMKGHEEYVMMSKVHMQRSDNVVYMFGYCNWGLGISCVMRHIRWFEVA